MTTPTTPSLRTQTKWADGITARIVTHMGLLLDNPEATVDITTHHGHAPNLDTHEAACKPCGWNTPRYTDRNKVLDQAQDHANVCTALPNPAAGTTAQPAIHHSH